MWGIKRLTINGHVPAHHTGSTNTRLSKNKMFFRHAEDFWCTGIPTQTYTDHIFPGRGVDAPVWGPLESTHRPIVSGVSSWKSQVPILRTNWSATWRCMHVFIDAPFSRRRLSVYDTCHSAPIRASSVQLLLLRLATSRKSGRLGDQGS